MLSREDMDSLMPVGDRRDPDYVTEEGFLMGERLERGFDETFDAALGRFYDEDLAISTFLAGKAGYAMGAVGKLTGGDRLDFTGSAYEDRDNKLRAMKDNGEIPPEIWEAYSGAGGLWQDKRPYFDQLAKWARKQGRTDILTDKQVKSGVRDELKARRAYTDEVDANGSLAGSLAGQLTAAMSDPPNMITAVVMPIAAIRGVGVMSNAMRAAVFEAGVATGTEILIQGQVYRFKQDMDAPYPFKNAMYNVLAATAGGAIFGAAMGAVGVKLAKGVKVPDDAPDPTVVTTKEVSSGIKTIQRRAYHGTDVDIEGPSLRTDGLGAHVAVKPGTAAAYAGTNNGGVYELDVNVDKLLRVSDIGDNHKMAEPVISQFESDGILPPGSLAKAEKELMEGLDAEDTATVIVARQGITEEKVAKLEKMHKDGDLDDEAFAFYRDAAEGDGLQDLPDKFMENNEKVLRGIKEQFKKDGYEGLVYEGGSAGPGEMYVLFDPEQAKTVGKLTPDSARALDDAAVDTKMYTDELDKSPEVPIRAHEENVQGQTDVLNDPAPTRYIDPPEGEEALPVPREGSEDTSTIGADGVQRTVAEEVAIADDLNAKRQAVLECESA